MYLYRTFIGEICCEIGIPKEHQRAILVLCPGLPGTPKEQQLCMQLVSSGYAVIYPRYAGTYESHGTFLAQSPAQTLIDMLTQLQTDGEFVELYAKRHIVMPRAPVIFLGNSFGALVAGNAVQALGDAALLLCPVTDWNTQGTRGTEQHADAILEFIARAYPNVYRTESWENIAELLPAIPRHSNKPVAMVFTTEDRSIDVTRAEDYAQGNAFVTTMPGPHIPFSKLPYNELLKMLETLQDTLRNR